MVETLPGAVNAMRSPRPRNQRMNESRQAHGEPLQAAQFSPTRSYGRKRAPPSPLSAVPPLPTIGPSLEVMHALLRYGAHEGVGSIFEQFLNAGTVPRGELERLEPVGR